MFLPSLLATFVADIRGLTWEEQFLLSTLQGILNRDAPRVFLIWDRNCERWMEWDRKRFGVEFRRLGSPWDLLRIAKESGLVRGYIVWDPAAPETANVATTIAGVEDLIAVSPRLEAKAKAAGFVKRGDLRGKFAGWDRVRVYRWAFENLFPRCNKKVVTCLEVPATVEVDLSPFLKEAGGVRIRFEDVTKSDGLGAKLRRITIFDGRGRVAASFRAGTPEEEKFLVEKDHSWLDRDGDRIADRDQFFVYEFRLPKGSKATATIEVYNGYLIKVAPLGTEKWKTVAQAPPTKGFVAPDNRIKDVTVALRAFTFNLSSDPANFPREYALRTKILEALDKPGWVLGWHTNRCSEGDHVRHASITGNLVMCSGAPNLSFHRHIGPKVLPKPRYLPPPPLDEGKVYISFVLSDGDALWCDYSFQRNCWDLRGRVPFGWEVQPLLVELAPDILTFYIETATEKDCLAGAFGAGYNYPNLMPKGLLENYLGYTREVLKRTGFEFLTILCAGPAKRELAEAYERFLGDIVFGVQEGYSGLAEGEDFLLPRLVWLKTRFPRGKKGEEMLRQLEEFASHRKDRPLFVPFHLPLGYDIKDAIWLAQRLDGRAFEVVRPDQLFALVRRCYERRPLLRGPEELATIPGLPTEAEFSLLTVKKGGLSVEVRVEGGRAEPPKFRVAPGRKATFRVVWERPKGTARARLLFDGGRVEIALPVRSVEPDVEVPKGAKVKCVKVYKATDMLHRLGHEEKIEGSFAPEAWVARPGVEDLTKVGAGHIVYGPYLRLDRGRYLVVFRLMLPSPFEGEVCVLDSSAGVGREILASRRIGGRNLRPGKWVDIGLPLELPSPKEGVEFRVEWLGKAPLAVDEIFLFRIEGEGET